MKKTIAVLACLLITAFSATALAQDSREAAQTKLTQALQGTRVSLKMDMPATQKGVVVAAGSIDQEKYQKRLKTYGTAIKNGEATVITGVRISGDEIVVEFAGGGAPEIDLTALVGVEPSWTNGAILEDRSRSRTNAERASKVVSADKLRSQVRYEVSKSQREESLRTADYRDRKKAAIAKARELNLKMGSRFIIKFDNRNAASITPEDLTKLLSAYVSF